MSLKHHLKMWFQQKIWSKPDKSHSEETVALPEVHTGKVHHPAEDTSHATAFQHQSRTFIYHHNQQTFFSSFDTGGNTSHTPVKSAPSLPAA